MYDVLTLLLLVFLVLMLVLDRVERHLVSLMILLVLLLSGSMTIDEVLRHVNWDVLGLILGVAVLTIYLEESGLSNMVANHVVKLSKGSRILFVLLISLISGLISIFMENVSVVILLFPVVVASSRMIGVNPVVPTILMALSANISGSATMIGDPPALITAGAFNLAFMDFIVYNGKPSMFFFTIVSMISAIFVTSYIAVRRLGEPTGGINGNGVLLVNLDKLFVVEALIALIVKILLLSLRHVLAISLSLTALISVGLITALRLLHRDVNTVKKALKRGFEWKLLVFLIGVFALSGSFEKHGLARVFADTVVNTMGFNIILVASSIMLLNIMLSSVIDNVPITVTMIPVVNRLAASLGSDPVVLMWSALIGITLGGNLTYIGASANVTAVRLLEKTGYKVSFIDFMKISSIYNTVSVVIAWVLYVLIYLV